MNGYKDDDPRMPEVRMLDPSQVTHCEVTHFEDCWKWGPMHYACALRKIEEQSSHMPKVHRLRAVMWHTSNGTIGMELVPTTYPKVRSLVASAIVELKEGVLDQEWNDATVSAQTS